MNETKVKEYDKFIEGNYRYLLGFCKSIDPKNDYEDLMQLSYLKCRERITKNGYSGDTFLNYFRCTAMNTYKSGYKKARSKTIIDIEDPDYHATIEQTLLTKEEQQEQDKLIEYELSYISNGIYEYVEKYFNKKERFIFATYFLLKHKHLNYSQLSDATGYSMTSVSNIIKRIKKELRQNLVIYLKTGKSMNELLEEVRLLLEKNPSSNYGSYELMYEKLYGQKYTGCRCKSNKIRMPIQDWYNKNKPA